MLKLQLKKNCNIFVNFTYLISCNNFVNIIKERVSILEDFKGLIFFCILMHIKLLVYNKMFYVQNFNRCIADNCKDNNYVLSRRSLLLLKNIII